MVKETQKKAGTRPASAAKADPVAHALNDSAQQMWQAGLGALARVQEESSKAVGQWGKLETIFEDRVAQALRNLGIPTRHDIEELQRRIDALTQTVQALSKPQDTTAAPRRRTAARKPVK